jgi:hypothetical protein
VIAAEDHPSPTTVRASSITVQVEFVHLNN